MSSAVDSLADLLGSAIDEALATHTQADLFDGLAAAIASRKTARPVPASTNATVDGWLEAAIAAGSPNDLAAAVLAASPDLPWLRSYEHLDPSPGLAAFQPNYTFLLLFGPTFRGRQAPFESDEILVGFTLQEPNILYPEHHHEPSEMYGVISGELEWLVGDTWSTVGPGDVIVHRPHESHAMRTGDSPVLTWVAWPHKNTSDIYMPSLDPPEKTMDPIVY